MNELIKSEVTMTSLEVVELVNNLRKEEGNEKVKRHDNLVASIDKEIEGLQNVGINPFLNFKEWYYQAEEGGRKYRGYQLNKAGIMQILNKESAYVRFKTQQYIEALENALNSQKQLPATVLEIQNELKKYLPKAIGSKDIYVKEYCKTVKRELHIKKKDADYEHIMGIFMTTHNVTRLEDIPYSPEVIMELVQLCRKYKETIYKKRENRLF